MPRTLALLTLAVASLAAPAHAWFDDTHRAVMEASGAPYGSCVAIAPDILAHRLVTEGPNHYSNQAAPITPADVLRQVDRVDRADAAGHVYGAIVVSARHVAAALASDKRPNYAYGFLAHYVGDLSQPLHNSPYDAFNQQHHRRIDGLVEQVPNLPAAIAARMRPLHLRNEAELATAIADVANAARAADVRLRHSGDMSQDEALDLLGRSASLLRAINDWVGIGRSL
jgi:hypothetical protein